MSAVEVARDEDQPDMPMTNLCLILLDRMRVQEEKIGDSTGSIDHLTDM